MRSSEFRLSYEERVDASLLGLDLKYAGDRALITSGILLAWSDNEVEDAQVRYGALMRVLRGNPRLLALLAKLMSLADLTVVTEPTYPGEPAVAPSWSLRLKELAALPVRRRGPTNTPSTTGGRAVAA